jgi:hypothetical protein
MLRGEHRRSLSRSQAKRSNLHRSVLVSPLVDRPLVRYLPGEETGT